MSNKGLNSHPSADTANYTPPFAAVLTEWGGEGGGGWGGEGVFLSSHPPPPPASTRLTVSCCSRPPRPGTARGCFHRPALAPRAGQLCYKKAPRLMEWDTTVTTWTRPALLPTRLLRFLVSPMAQNLPTSPPTLGLEICCCDNVGFYLFFYF